MIRTSLLYIPSLSEDDKEKELSLMTEERRAVIMKKRAPMVFLHSIAGDILARKTISDVTGTKKENIVFVWDELGKPSSNMNGVCRFSISHSGDYAFCAVSDFEVGADIERVREIDARVANRVCTQGELDYIGSDSERFIRLWTLKEAYVKALGTGLGTDIKATDFHIVEQNISSSLEGLEFAFCDAPQGYIASVCTLKQR